MDAQKTTRSDTGSAQPAASPQRRLIVEKIFWCPQCQTANKSGSDSLTDASGHNMQPIGWMEYDEAEASDRNPAN